MRTIITAAALSLVSTAVFAQVHQDPGSFADMNPYLSKCPGVDEATNAINAIPKPNLNGLDQNAQIVATCAYMRKKLPFDIQMGKSISYCAAHDLPILGQIDIIYNQGFLHGFGMKQAATLCHLDLDGDSDD